MSVLICPHYYVMVTTWPGAFPATNWGTWPSKALIPGARIIGATDSRHATTLLRRCYDASAAQLCHFGADEPEPFIVSAQWWDQSSHSGASQNTALMMCGEVVTSEKQLRHMTLQKDQKHTWPVFNFKCQWSPLSRTDTAIVYNQKRNALHAAILNSWIQEMCWSRLVTWERKFLAGPRTTLQIASCKKKTKRGTVETYKARVEQMSERDIAPL